MVDLRLLEMTDGSKLVTGLTIDESQDILILNEPMVYIDVNLQKRLIDKKVEEAFGLVKAIPEDSVERIIVLNPKIVEENKVPTDFMKEEYERIINDYFPPLKETVARNWFFESQNELLN